MANLPQRKNYKPTAAVWEITMDCNMRCKHCGSSCSGPLPDELTTAEALEMCDALKCIGLQRITLSGGEPFVRPDWDQIASRLIQNNISTNILSNGWYIERDTIRRAKEIGITNIGISLDGIENTHDFIRKKGSFSRIMEVLALANEEKMLTGIVTCIHKKNLGQLPEMKKILLERGVADWQLQAAVPMGNLLKYPDWLMEPAEISDVIDFAYDIMKEGRIGIHLTDVFGYFTRKEIEIRRAGFKSQYNLGLWNGCPAGKDLIGIRCNGDIIGCLSIRDDSLIEGNVRQTPLEELWTRPGAFSWNRDNRRDKLTGFCKICQYAQYCQGGCSGIRRLRYKTMTETKFCAYYAAIEKEREKVSQINDIHQLISTGRELNDSGKYQQAELYISRALEKDEKNIELLNVLGFIHYKLKNYPECEECNRRVLEQDPGNIYALKGLGVSISKQGRAEEGIRLLRESVQLTGDDYLEPYHDLAAVLAENGRIGEALEVLETGREKSDAFCEVTENLYCSLKVGPRVQGQELNEASTAISP
ncbi:MAG: radical SAM protein [Candidatus Aminicenantes bacterium]|nr:radical SAM protein [Candidatus Aminicenantes bacterium]NIM82074.1 radical SAM protein [Candidatus Aminicenantes bacterium]NIN21468.1 radical SAM protein [Candidatus Aminicenantes bacterium]NIN45280.1 radical SAM protein [Candidatus Aminicenantes bacterium]NIN88097.1 radical SAM protein [Candidatus Aminicenantes bacterium]